MATVMLMQPLILFSMTVMISTVVKMHTDGWYHDTQPKAKRGRVRGTWLQLIVLRPCGCQSRYFGQGARGPVRRGTSVPKVGDTLLISELSSIHVGSELIY